MVTTLGTILGTSLGTELGTMDDVVDFNPNLLYGLSDFSAANWYQTASGGGEGGVATGWGYSMLISVDAFPATFRRILQRWLGTGAGGGGYTHQIDSTGFGDDATFVSGNVNTSAAGRITLSPSMARQLQLFTVVVTGGDIRRYLGPHLMSVTPMVGYTPAVTRTTLGAADGGGAPFTGGKFVSALQFTGAPSVTQIQALAKRVRDVGDLPITFPLTQGSDADIAGIAPVIRLRADSFTPSGPNVGSVPNLGSLGGTFNVVGGTIAAPTADAALNGRPTFVFANVARLELDLPLSALRFLHNGAPMYAVAVWVPDTVSANAVVWATNTLAGGDTGASQWTSATSVLRSTISAGGAGSPINLGTPSLPSALAVGQGIFAEISYQNSGTPEFFGSANNIEVFSTADTGIAPSAADSSAPLTVGSSGAGTVRFAGRIAEIFWLDRRPAEAERQRVRDYIRTRYGVGAITTTHRWSVRDVLAGLDLSVVDGQTAPANLPDTVTNAAIDRMDRQGSPTVRTIDPSVDGRKSYGALGFSGTAHLKSSAAVIAGATVDITTDLVLYDRGATQTIWTNVNHPTANAGIGLFISPSNTLSVYSYGASATVASAAINTSDFGILYRWRVTYDGSIWRLYKDGVQQGPDTAGAYAASTSPLFVGVHPNLGSEMRGGSWISRILIGSTHDYNITADVVDNGGPDNGVPAQVKDRIGTDHLTRVGGLAVVSGGIANFSATNTISTLAGIRGNAAGFWAEVLFVATAGASDARLIGTVVAATSGWSMYSYGTTALVNFSDGTAVRSSAFISIAPNVLTHLAIRHTGTQMETYVNGTLQHTAVFPVVAAAAGAMWLGAGQNTSAQPVLGGSGSDAAIPTPAEIATAAAAALSTGKVAGIPGKTANRWSIVDDVIEAGGKVPTIVKDRQGTTPLAVTNAKLEVAQRTERVWSYEATPILRGGTAWTSAAYYQAGAGVALGNPVGFWVAWLGVFPSGASAATRQFASALGGAGGWDMRITGAMAALSWRMYDATPNGVTYTSSVVGAGDLDKLQMYVAVWDGPGLRQRAYFKRNEVGTGTARNGYTPSPTDTLRLGSVPAEPSTAGDLVQTYGLAYGVGAPTLAQVQALFDAVQANERMVGIPGMTDNLFNLTQDFASGATSATIADRQGSAVLTRNGTPTYSERFARAWGW